jgi:hypothetical protein
MASKLGRRVIIRSKRFWYLYSDGRMEQVSLSERARAHLSQTKSTEARMAKEEAPKRRANNPPRPPGTAPMLPPAGRDIGEKTLTELAHDYGWGSVSRYTEALRENRPGVYEKARVNGVARGRANLLRPKATREVSN